VQEGKTGCFWTRYKKNFCEGVDKWYCL